MTSPSATGYKSPPKNTRFKKGTSGNRRGRPKVTPSFKSDLSAEMSEKITVADKNGREFKITKQRAFIKMLFAGALKNEKTAISALLTCMRYFGTGGEEVTPPNQDLEDYDALKEFVQRTEARSKQAASDAPTKQGTE